MTPEEKAAIKKLEDAFKEASRLGIKVCGMDGTLYYATRDAYRHGTKIRESKAKKHQAPYCEVAEAVMEKVPNADQLNTAKCYTDSGGW